VTLGLRDRLFLGFALVLVATLALVGVMTAREQERWVGARTRETLERAARVARHDLEAAARPVDWSELARASAGRLGCRVTWIALDGRVLGDSEVPRERLVEVENHAGRPEVRRALAGGVGWAVRHSRTTGFDQMYVAIPAVLDSAAVVRASEPLAALAQLRASLFRLSLLALAGALLVGLALVFGVASRQASRVRALEHVAASLGEGRVDARAAERPHDELGRLGRAVNRMAADLAARLDALARERDEREHILAHMSEGVALLDAEGRVSRANRRLGELLERPEPELGRPFRELARSPDLDALLEEARREGRVVERELRLWTERQRLVRASATPLDGPEGRSLLLVLHDLTEAERLNRVRQDFVANVSHELRTPLTSMRGYAETLLDGGLEDTEHREGFVRIIRDQTARLQDLVDDLLSLSELERPGATLRISRFDLRARVAGQAAAFAERAMRAGLTLALEPGPPLEIAADQARLDQVVANLLDNAVKYTERGGIRLALGATSERVWCEVADTGPGIPPEDRSRVFERFYRVDKARSRDKGGTGLGLAIVKHIVTLHGGDVSLASEIGKGSVFRFSIPRESRQPPDSNRRSNDGRGPTSP